MGKYVNIFRYVLGGTEGSKKKNEILTGILFPMHAYHNQYNIKGPVGFPKCSLCGTRLCFINFDLFHFKLKSGQHSSFFR